MSSKSGGLSEPGGVPWRFSPRDDMVSCVEDWVGPGGQEPGPSNGLSGQCRILRGNPTIPKSKD